MSRRDDRLTARKARRSASALAAATILPPEGVPLSLPIAGLGVRLGAQLADILITGGAALSLWVLLLAMQIADPQSLLAILMLLFFLIRIPYYLAAELAWNGQTLGKKLMKIKVVAHNGGPLTTHALVLRNLMKEAEIFLPGTLVLSLDGNRPIEALLYLAWIAMAFAIPLFSPYRRRLGDIMAGTHVVHLPKPVLLKDMARPNPKVGRTGVFTFLSHQLDHYGAFELQTLETFLRADETRKTPDANERHRKTVVAIVEKIRAKIGYPDPVPQAEAVAFLRSFYNAQRAHLEQRQLFGDRREDKRYAEKG